MEPTRILRGATRLARLAIGVSLLVGLGGCGGGAGGGRPSIVLESPTVAEVESTLNTLFHHAKPPELSSFGGAVVTCAAIGCPVPEALHVDYVPGVHGRLDFSGFDFVERRRSVSLARKSQSSGTGHFFIDRRTLGGWMDHSFFLVEATNEGRYAEFSYRTYSMGNASTVNPAVSVSGTWSGVMAGVIASFSDEAGAFVTGDATVTVAYADAAREASVDVEFTRITREDTGDPVASMAWENLVLEAGRFGAGNVVHNDGEGYFGREGSGNSADGSIFGQFYGPDHEEVGGLFNRNGLAGAFGANRNN